MGNVAMAGSPVLDWEMFLLRRMMRGVDPLRDASGERSEEKRDEKTGKWVKVPFDYTQECFAAAKRDWNQDVWGSVAVQLKKGANVAMDDKAPSSTSVAVTDPRVVCGVANLYALFIEMEKIYYNHISVRMPRTRAAFKEWLDDAAGTLDKFKDGQVTMGLLREVQKRWREAKSLLAM